MVIMEHWTWTMMDCRWATKVWMKCKYRTNWTIWCISNRLSWMLWPICTTMVRCRQSWRTLTIRCSHCHCNSSMHLWRMSHICRDSFRLHSYWSSSRLYLCPCTFNHQWTVNCNSIPTVFLTNHSLQSIPLTISSTTQL